MAEMMDGAVVVVTGASRGLGLAIARRLASAGTRLVLAVRSESSAGTLRQEFGEPAIVVQVDVAAPEAARTVLEGAMQRFGRVDGLVNNAGVIEPIGLLADTDPEAWEQAIRTNLVAPYRFIRELVGLTAAGKRRIVNISSGAAGQPFEGWSAYCAGKAGLAMLTRSVHLEYGGQVLAFGLTPGLVDTDMQVTIRSSGLNRVSQLPRSSLRPAEEPAAAAAYLLSGEGDDLAGGDIDIRDAGFRRRVGIPPL